MQNGKEPTYVYARPPGYIGHVPSPPLSPGRSPRLRNGRSFGRTKSGKMVFPVGPPPAPHTLWQRLTLVLLTFLVRRHGVLLLAPLVYVSGMVLYMGSVSMDLPRLPRHAPPGSIYRSDEVFRQLWPEMERANASAYGAELGLVMEVDAAGHGRQVLAAWEYPKEGGGYVPCLDHLHHDSLQGVPESNGYILIEANGGLNQQRSSICNAVAVARLLNATLIIPRFHFNSVWRDPSKFGEIYDEDHFIDTLARQVRVVRQLPDEIMAGYDNTSMIYKIKVKAWAKPSFYLDTVLPELINRGVIRFSPFANRLSYDGIPKTIQKLRCFTNFEALRFAQPIASTGQLLVKRMIAKSANSDGNYVAVHLRFEEDMVAFSCCIYEGGKEEKHVLDNARESAWKGKFNKTGRVINPAAIRMNGKCPLTPLEVGMMLRGMGFRNTTPIYLAAGKIYKEKESMEPLWRMYPYLQTKETLLSREELAPFKEYSSRMAALDYTVCLHSEVFVTTQGGNFPQILIGHRRFLNKGHSKTIRPDKRKLALLLDNPNIGWERFSSHLEAMRRHSDLKGLELRKKEASIYTYPVPDCMCPEDTNSIHPRNPQFQKVR